MKIIIIFFVNCLMLYSFLPFQGKSLKDLGFSDFQEKKDITEILQKSFESGERAIYLPPGLYVINQLKMPNNTILFGAGDTTIIYPAEKGKPIFKQDGGAYWQIANMTLRGLETKPFDKSILKSRELRNHISKHRLVANGKKGFKKKFVEEEYLGIIDLKNTTSYTISEMKIENVNVGVSFRYDQKTYDSGFLKRITFKNCNIGVLANNKGDANQFSANLREIDFIQNQVGFATVGEGFFLLTKALFQENGIGYYYYTKGTKYAQEIVGDSKFLHNYDWSIFSLGSDKGFQFANSEFNDDGLIIKDNVGFMFVDNRIDVAILDLSHIGYPFLLKANTFVRYPQHILFKRKLWAGEFLNFKQFIQEVRLTEKSIYLYKSLMEEVKKGLK